MIQWFVIYASDASMNTIGNPVPICTETEMDIDDILKAIAAYDRLRKNRNRPRRASYAKTQEDLATAFQIGKISRSTYYRRLKELGLSPESPMRTPV